MMVQVANELCHRGFSAELILVDSSGPHASMVNSKVETAEIGGGSTPSILYRLWTHLQKYPPDVLLSTMEIPNIVSVLATRYPRSIPVVLRSASIYSKRERTGKYRLIPLLKRLIYPKADSIVTISDGVAHDLADATGIDASEMTTIYNPAFDPEIHQMAREPVDHRWLNDDSAEVVISVGNMKPAKDFPTLLRAIHLLQEHQETRLIILGKGDGKPALMELAQSLGIADRISFPGFVENPYAYMARADVFALSSAWEGFGHLIVEPMACGPPVVCTDCPGGPAEILSHGTYGPLVSVGDAEALADAILDQLSNPTSSELLQERARDFHIETIVDQYERVLTSVAN